MTEPSVAEEIKKMEGEYEPLLPVEPQVDLVHVLYGSRAAGNLRCSSAVGLCRAGAV